MANIWPAIYIPKCLTLHFPKPRWYRFWSKRRRLQWLKSRNRTANIFNVGVREGRYIVNERLK